MNTCLMNIYENRNNNNEEFFLFWIIDSDDSYELASFWKIDEGNLFTLIWAHVCGRTGECVCV